MARHRAIGLETAFQKKALVILFIFLLFLLGTPIAFAQGYNRGSAVVLMNADTGEVLYEESPSVRMEIASTTKILTAICVIEHNDIFRECVIPNEAVGVEGSSIYLKKGEKWHIIDLLYGLMLRSGNDAAAALAILTSDNLPNFCDLMNETARRAGATNSHFTNPHGLHDENHYSTAKDMAMITAYALKSPIFNKICRTKTHTCEKITANGAEKQVFYNKNKLLYSYEYATGVKTGYTTHSGRCLVTSAEKEGVRLICVTLNVYDTYGVSRKLFDEYFAKQKGSTFIEKS